MTREITLDHPVDSQPKPSDLASSGLKAASNILDRFDHMIKNPGDISGARVAYMQDWLLAIRYITDRNIESINRPDYGTSVYNREPLTHGNPEGDQKGMVGKALDNWLLLSQLASNAEVHDFLEQTGKAVYILDARIGRDGVILTKDGVQRTFMRKEPSEITGEDIWLTRTGDFNPPVHRAWAYIDVHDDWYKHVQINGTNTRLWASPSFWDSFDVDVQKKREPWINLARLTP